VGRTDTAAVVEAVEPKLNVGEAKIHQRIEVESAKIAEVPDAGAAVVGRLSAKAGNYP
jgi:hypothetical protein